MRPKFFVLVTLVCLCVATVVLAADESDSTDAEMPTTANPEITQVEGNTEATLEPSKYPLFYDYQSNDPACGDYLKQQFKVQTGDEDNGIADSGMSLAPIYLKSKMGDGTYTGGQKRDFEKLPGLDVKGFEIPEEYRKKAGILVTWTVRIEGSQPDAYPVLGKLCSSSWAGTSYQSFPPGDVKTKLVVNAKPMGPEACMTIPDGGKTQTTEKPKPPPGDPTHTGSYLITPKDFNGLLPATLDLEIQWKNETTQVITSPANDRSVVVTLLPEGNQEEK